MERLKKIEKQGSGRIFSMLKSCFVSLFCAGLIGIITAGTGNCADYYVSPDGLDSNSGTIGAPFKTVVKARDVVRTVNSSMSSNINVYLRGGWYTQPSALSFNSNDSGKNGYNVIYQAYGSERPVISGGRQITGWTLHDSGKNIWKASASGLSTRQLYVNCVRAVRAHKGSGVPGASKTSSGYTTSDTSMQSWGNITGIEFVFNGNNGGTGDGGNNHALWVEHRIGVAGISGTNITMKNPAWSNVTSNSPHPALSAYYPTDIENAYELLDQQGEWYLNSSQGVIYYIPRSGDNMSTAVVVAPVLETLVSGSSVNNVQFKGITFAHATYLRPNGNEGFLEHQANSLIGTWAYIPANVYFDYSQSLRFERCMFKHLGSIGLHLGSNCKNNVVTGCVFTDISGNNILLGNNTDPAGSSTRATGNQVTNCYVHDSCVEYHGGVGIVAAYTADTLISHNEIAYLPYSGVSVGWGWGQDPSYYMQNNRTSNNYIHHFMQVMSDGAGVYTLSAQPGSTINNNWFDTMPWRGAGGAIYNDEMSEDIEVYNNVCSNMSNYWWFANIPLNIYVHDNWSNTSSIYNGCTTGCTVSNTVIISGSLSNWPAGAQSVANASGIEGSYNDIRTMTCACSYGSTPPPPNTPPSITSQPSNATVTAGQTAGFSVGASGSSPLSYQWQKNQSNISGATGASYTTPATALSDSGAKYRCVVTNSYGSATSNEATLTVTAASANLALNKTAAASSVWTGYPASNGNDGSNNSLWASESGDASPWWQVDLGAAYQIGSVQIVARQDTNEEQPDSQNNFEVRGSNNSDGSGYTVLASLGSTPYPTNGSWSSSVANTGSYRYLRVAKTDGAHVNFSEFIANGTGGSSGTAPSITSQPSNVTVTVGQTATFIVSASGTSPLSYQWQKNQSNISGAAGASYTTPATTTSDNGAKFRCVVSNSAGSATSNEATLTVNSTPPVGEVVAYWKFDEGTGTSVSDSSGKGNTGTLNTSQAWGTGKVNGCVNLDGVDDVMTSNYALPANNFTLSAWVKTSATHEIDAQGSSGYPGTSGQMYLFWPDNKVADAGAGISMGTNGISVYEHGNGYMPALAVYSGSLGTGWNHVAVVYENKQPKIYLNGALVTTGVVSPRGSVYAPGKIGGDVYGYFGGGVDEVKVYSYALASQAVKDLYDSYSTGGTAPSITSQPSNATVTVGQTAGFSVGASGSSPLSYQWQKNQANISGAAGASYTTPATALSDSGAKYRCVVTNSAGSATSNEATLTVNPASTTQELVGNWKLDEASGSSAADSSGKGNTGTLSGSPAWSPSGGKVGGALSLDGTDDTMSWNYSAPVNNFSISVWVKATTTHEIDTESNSGYPGTSGERYLFWPDHKGANAGAGISVGTNGISVYEHGDGYMPALAVYSGSLGTGWNHVAVVYENRQPKIYLNGALVRTGVTSAKSAVYAPSVMGGGAYGYYPGTADEVRVYNYALSAANVQNIYNEVNSPPSGELVAYWKLNETSGSSAADSSGQGKTGTLGGSPVWSPSGGKIGGALNLDGVNDIMTWTYSAPVNNFSICAWVKASATHGIDAESTSGYPGTTGERYLFWPNNKGTNAGAGISVGTNGISVYEHGNGYMPALAVYSGSLGTGWNHIAVVYANKQPKIYLNGALVRTGLTSTKASVYAPTVMGGGSYGYFPGTADEVRIYNKALTLQEIQSIYNTLTGLSFDFSPAAINVETVVYPNPCDFSDGQVANFKIRDISQPAGVKIFTLSGELVRALGSQEGASVISWDGTNESGQKVTRGIYLYTITQGSDKITGKLVVKR